MFNQLLKKLTGNQDNPVDRQHSIELATAVLMVEVARADNVFDSSEMIQIQQLLQQELNLSEVEIKDIINEARSASDQAISLQGFTRKLCETLDNAERVELVTNLWRVAYADGELGAHERHIVRKISALLYLNEKQIIAAKIAAQTA